MARRRKGEVDHPALEAAVLAPLEKRAGRRPQWSTVLDRFPGVSRATLFRARDAVLKRSPDIHRPAGQSCPTASMALPPPPTLRDLNDPPMEPASRLVSKRINASLLDSWCTTLGYVDGVLLAYGPEKPGLAPRNPRYFMDALALRDKTVMNMLRMAGKIYNSELVQVLTESVIKRLRGRDKALAAAVLDDITDAFDDVGVDVKGVRV